MFTTSSKLQRAQRMHFSYGREHSTSMYGELSVEYAYTQFFSTLCVSGTMLKQSQGSRQVSREHAKCIVLYVTRTLSTYTSNVGNLHTSTVQLYGDVPPLLIWPSHVVRYPCGRERNIEMYLYTKSMPTLGFVKISKTVQNQ